jgi:hypothetical protein
MRLYLQELEKGGVVHLLPACAGTPSMAASTPGCRAHRETVRVRPGEAALSPPPLLLLRSCDESPERLQ